MFQKDNNLGNRRSSFKRSNVSLSRILYGKKRVPPTWCGTPRFVFWFYNTRYLHISTRWRSWAVIYGLWSIWRNVESLLFLLFSPLQFSWLFFSLWKIAERNYLSVGILKKIWHVQTSTSKVFSNTYHKTELIWRSRSVNPTMVFYYQREMGRGCVSLCETTVTKSHINCWVDLFMKLFKTRCLSSCNSEFLCSESSKSATMGKVGRRTFP